jgi:DNA-binding response OmpR family regulator
VLVVDDDREIVRLIADSLAFEGFRACCAYTGKEALEKLAREPIDFMILDIMMPQLDGLEVCRRIRQQIDIPILLLSAKDRDLDKIVGLELGADDYMTKPFSVEELMSRVKAHLRKQDRLYRRWREEHASSAAPVPAASSAPAAVPINPALPLSLNPDAYEAYRFGERLELSTKEFQILYYLSRHPGQVMTREQIYESVWGDEFGDINTVTVHIKNIRKKLGKECDAIRTIWGVGYKYGLERPRP